MSAPFRRLNTVCGSGPRKAPALRVEALEERDVPATFTVTNLTNAGAGSLRQAVLDANAMAGADTIVFQAGLTGPIVLTTGELAVTGAVDIQGPGPNVVTVNGNAASRIFNIDNGAAGAIVVSISGLALTNGKVGAGLDGGAILIADENVTLRNMLITANEAGDDGGGIAADADATTLAVFDSTISGNKATDGGGGAMLYGSSTFQNCTISGNTTGNDGGGLYWDVDTGETLTITNCLISGNTATGGGGALYTDGTDGTLTIRNTAISGNTAGASGGGLYLSHTGTSLVDSCLISGNQSKNGGAGVIVRGGAVTIRNSTVTGNSVTAAATAGGGIRIDGGTLIVENSTIANNTATGNGGGISEAVAVNPILRNTIVANNVGAANPDLDGTFDAGGSLIRTPGAAVINTVGGANILNQNPLLGALANNGGFTQTLALQAGSPAINAGVLALLPAGTNFDQRGPGFPRVINGLDIGAFEVQPPFPLLVSGSLDGKASVFVPNAAGTYPTAAGATVAPFGNTGGNVRVAAGDVNGDGFADSVVVTGPGTAIRLGVISGKDNTTVLVAPFDPFGGNFTGGGFVSTGDIDNDGRAEFLVSPDQGGGPRVTIFSLVGTNPTQRANFFGIDDANFRGGARTALGDINADGTLDLIVCAGFLGGPRTAIFNGTTLFTTPTRLIGDFFAFPGTDAVTLRNGVFVASGDINGDGFDDLVFGGGPGGAPRVFILSGALVAVGNVAGAQAAPIANFFVAGDANNRGGVRLATTNADNDIRADVAAGSGEGVLSGVRVYLGKNFTSTAEPTTFQDLNPFNTVLAGGVFVG